MLGTSEQTTKISKTGFAKIGHTTVSKPQWVGFSSKKTRCDKFESWKNFFSISLLGLFSPEPPEKTLVKMINRHVPQFEDTILTTEI